MQQARLKHDQDKKRDREDKDRKSLKQRQEQDQKMDAELKKQIEILTRVNHSVGQKSGITVKASAKAKIGDKDAARLALQKRMQTDIVPGDPEFLDQSSISVISPNDTTLFSEFAGIRR